MKNKETIEEKLKERKKEKRRSKSSSHSSERRKHRHKKKHEKESKKHKYKKKKSSSRSRSRSQSKEHKKRERSRHKERTSEAKDISKFEEIKEKAEIKNIEKIEQKLTNPKEPLSKPMIFSDITLKTKSLENMQKELILSGSDPIYIGAQCLNDKRKLSNPRFSKDQNFLKKIQDKEKAGVLDAFLENDKYKNSVLNPEKHLKCAWTASINKAFMDGAISSGRDIILITNHEYYNFDDENFANNGTLYELLALKANNYKFEINKEGKIIAKSQQSNLNNVNLSMFDDYKNISEEPNYQNRAVLIKDSYSKHKQDIKELKSTFQDLKNENPNVMIIKPGLI